MGLRHVEVVRQLGLDLVGVADARPEALKLAVDDHGVHAGACFSDARDALRKCSAECVIIATTAPSHAELVIDAAERGAEWILCEKPLGVSLAECDEMIGACERAGALLAVNHQMRFMEQYITPKRMLESEAFGGFESVTVVAGNFGLAMNGTHYMEMFRFMAGEPPAAVGAWFSDEIVPNPRGAQFQDRAGAVRAVTASGKRFYLDASAGQGHGMTALYAARNGQIVVDELSGHLRSVVREAEHRSLPTTRYGMPAEERTEKITPADSTAPTRAVLSSLLSGEGFPTGQEGRLAVAALVAAHVSHDAGGRMVALDDALPRNRVFPWA